MGRRRHGYDRSVLPPFDADLGAAVADRGRRLLLASAAAAAVEVLLVAATALLGPADVRWWVGVAGKGGGTVLWDEVLPASDLVPLVLLLTLPGLAVTALSTHALVRRVRRRAVFRAPRAAPLGVALTHALAPSLAVAGLVQWAGWGGVGHVVAGLLPQLGTTVLVIVLLMSHERVDPWAWADPTSRRGRRERERWAQRVERAHAERARAQQARVGRAQVERADRDPEPVRD